MSQFWTDSKHNKKHLSICLNKLQCTNIFIRYVGSHGGGGVVDEDIYPSDDLEIIYDKKNIKFILNSKTLFETVEWYMNGMKGFSVEYRDDYNMSLLYIKDPDHISSKDVKYSALRSIVGEHGEYLLEITFKGKIQLKRDGEFYEGWERYVIDM